MLISRGKRRTADKNDFCFIFKIKPYKKSQVRETYLMFSYPGSPKKKIYIGMKVNKVIYMDLRFL